VETVFKRLPQAILPWYYENRRELPWRQTKEPYRVWLSEIMLQQTRVEAVKGYYVRFLEVLPTVETLASCDDDTLNKLWEGLGYYSRVRNLKKAAGVILRQYGGKFPQKYEDVIALPGIGEYTAGAVCSICFDLPTPAVDGNVLRVAARLQNDNTPIDLPARKKWVQQALAEVYPKEAGDFTQALMELGATVCGPNRKPMCEACPCQEFCRGYRQGTMDTLPVKLPKRSRKIEEKTVFVLSCDGRYALKKRGDEGLLAGLWQFPDVPGKKELEAALTAAEQMGLRPKTIYRNLERSHIFTHIRWDMTCYYLEVAEQIPDFVWLTADEIDQEAALPTAYRQFWEGTSL